MELFLSQTCVSAFYEVNRVVLTLFTQMDFPRHVDYISMELSILYFKHFLSY